MDGASLLAYPILLGSVYGAFKIGRRAGIARRHWMEWARLVFLSGFLVLITVLQIRFAASGLMENTWAVFVGVSSLAAGLGMLGLQAFEMVEAWTPRAVREANARGAPVRES